MHATNNPDRGEKQRVATGMAVRGPALVTVAQLSEFDEIIDARSEGEFAEDHVPGAINCPVLDNNERARVGTIYKQRSSFEAKKIGAALVSDDETPVPSIVTERDILQSLGAGEDPDSERVCDHMSDGVISAAPDWSLERAAAEMSRRGIRHLAVYEGPELVGVLSMRDIVRVWTSDGATSGMSPD